MTSKSVLGRGVGALLPEDLDTVEDERFFLCDIDKIKANPNQPRSYFDEGRLQELAESISEHGVIQPLLVTKAKGNRYSLIAGERRLRAARIAGEDEVPVVVMDSGSEEENLELALIENIQRHDLNPIEEATAYARLIEEFKLTQEEVAGRVGRKRSTITNMLRLLKLPETLQNDVAVGNISGGHARVLLRLKDNMTLMQSVRDKIIKEDLSVRQTENICRQTQQKVKTAPKPKVKGDELPSSYCRALATQLTNELNTKVKIVQNGGRGKLEIEYYSSDDLDRLVSLVSGEG
ncbi:MAG: chromosome partitioning protein ParB [Desulfobulbus sp.]|nr:MAG: chromosome partitioning protein ParB [Desulfobulbus sp.]RUM38124.1 MAG: chromosome partitioning protein ParB [Desulfobulbus sp.]